MKKILFYLVISCSAICYSQNSELRNGVLKTPIGYELREKDQIVLGTGSNVDGSFNFIEEKETNGLLKGLGSVAKIVGKVGLTATGLGGVGDIIANGLTSLTGVNVGSDLVNTLIGGVANSNSAVGSGANALMSAFNNLSEGNKTTVNKEAEIKNELANLASMLSNDTQKPRISRSFAGYRTQVLDIEESQNTKTGFAYLVVVKIDGKKYNIDIEKAMLFGEVVVPSNFNYKTLPQKIAEEKKKKEEEEEAARKKKEEEELAAKKKKEEEEEAARKKKEEEEAAAKKKKEEEEAAAKALQLQIQQQQQQLLQQMQMQAQQMQAQQQQAQQQQFQQQQYQQPVQQQQYQQPAQQQQYQQPVQQQQYQQPVQQQQYQQPVQQQQYQQPVQQQQYQQPVQQQQYQQPVQQQQYQQPVQQQYPQQPA